jgi:methyl-accepting chemotaxis protein
LIGSASMHVPILLGWSVAGSITAVALGLAISSDRWRARPDVAVLCAVMLAVNLVTDTGAVASAGGIAGPFWVLFLPVVLVAAAATEAATALLVGVLAAAGVYMSSVLAHTATPASAGRLLVVLPLFPTAAWAAAVLAAGTRQATAEAQWQRSALEHDVADLSHVLDSVADGDLSQIPSTTNGSSSATITLASLLADTLLALRRLVRHIASVGEQIAGNAGEVLHTAEEHAVAVVEQTAAVHETTSTIEELASTAAQIADTAERVARYAGQTLRFVEEGGQAVQASVAAMRVIAERVDGITDRAHGLGERTRRIGSILQVIDELSGQTNMLALNAAIEAARAGEHGRGFSLVAGEVRTLAERAREATSRIAQIVAEITAETSATIAASEAGAADVRSGGELAAGVVDALDRITRMVTDTTNAAREISVATRQQRVASESVVSAMGQVAEVTNRYRGGSERCVDAAEQLSALAGSLRESIRQFRLE